MIDGIFFDGQSTRRHPVSVIIHERILVMRGAAGLQRKQRVSRMQLSERLMHAPRILRFADGAFIEVSDPRLDQMLRANRFRDPLVVRWQQNWPLSLLCLLSLVALLASAYKWGLPMAADRLAQHLPATIEHKIGDQGLAMIDAHVMRPTKLDGATQQRLTQAFAALRQPGTDKTSYRLVFRDSGGEANAFALPNGVIVMTDQLVQGAVNEQAVMGVLSHELGHLQRRHSLRGLMQTIGVGVVLNLWVGDTSSALAAMPTFFLDQKYSRDFEREADQYAVDMMHANALPLTPLADLLEKMEADARERSAVIEARAARRAPGQARGRDDTVSDYFSSHPGGAERVAKLRAADQP